MKQKKVVSVRTELRMCPSLVIKSNREILSFSIYIRPPDETEESIEGQFYTVSVLL